MTKDWLPHLENCKASPLHAGSRPLVVRIFCPRLYAPECALIPPMSGVVCIILQPQRKETQNKAPIGYSQKNKKKLKTRPATACWVCFKFVLQEDECAVSTRYLDTRYLNKFQLILWLLRYILILVESSSNLNYHVRYEIFNNFKMFHQIMTQLSQVLTVLQDIPRCQIRYLLGHTNISRYLIRYDLDI